LVFYLWLMATPLVFYLWFMVPFFYFRK
jgi:hypothetical protein